MTQDQVMGLLRQILPIIGGIATALGWISPEKVASLTATILSIAGPIATIAGIVWSLIANSKSSIIAAASKMPEVKAITVIDPALAASARTADPATVVVGPH